MAAVVVPGAVMVPGSVAAVVLVVLGSVAAVVLVVLGAVVVVVVWAARQEGCRRLAQADVCLLSSGLIL